MKIWIKFLIGISIGAVIAVFVPQGDDAYKFICDIALVCVHIGKYAVFPLVFFSFLVATYELRIEKKLKEVFKKFFLYLLVITAVCAFVGTVSGFFLPVEKLPGPGTTTPVINAVPVLDLLKENVFPSNLFSIFTQIGFSLFPVILLAFIIGLNVDYEKQFTRPVVQFADGMSRIMYHVNSLIIEVFWIGMIAISAARILTLKNLKGGEAYIPFFITLTIDVVLVVIILLPLFLYYINNRKNPFHWLYASLGPAIAALFTGNHSLSVGMLVKHGKENMFVSRRIGSSVYTLGALFSKAGTALVVSLSAILLRKSTFGAEIPFLEYVWIFFASIVVSLVVSIASAPFPRTGAYAALALLCLGYINPNMPPDKYLDLGQIAPILLSVAVLIDVLVSSLIAFRISQEVEFQEDIDVKRCI